MNEKEAGMDAIALPEFGIRPGVRMGRNPLEGYQRGLGLERGIAALDSDPHFRACFALAAGRTVVSPMKLKNLYLLVRNFLPQLPPGDIFEFGSYRGGSALFLAAAARDFLPNAKVYALDTFSGMPETDPDSDLHRRGDFRNTVYEEVIKARDDSGLHNIEFVKGLFEETAPALVANSSGIVLGHIDCDIKSAVVFSYKVCKRKMVVGGYYVFDDSVAASCLGATEAVEETVIQGDGLLSEQIFPHHVFRAGLPR
jgi:hypothetical protein